jgi:hypothetical protein
LGPLGVTFDRLPKEMREEVKNTTSFSVSEINEWDCYVIPGKPCICGGSEGEQDFFVCGGKTKDGKVCPRLTTATKRERISAEKGVLKTIERKRFAYGKKTNEVPNVAIRRVAHQLFVYLRNKYNEEVLTEIDGHDISTYPKVQPRKRKEVI